MAPSGTTRRGMLLAAGGREIDLCNPAVLEEFLRLCGGPSACILVLTAASPHPQKKSNEYKEAFASLGAKNVTFLDHRNRQEAEAASVPHELEQADGVFFTGGNQLKLVTSLGGTRLLSVVRERHRNGLVVGGTSAGAAALSTIMIARGRPQAAPRLASARFAPGFGLVQDVIIDQHFNERDRFGRLLTAVLCNASMLGFGIDENTAFVLDPDERVSVVGRGTLTIIDGSELGVTNLAGVDDRQPVAFTGVRVHGLSAGWVFDLNSRRVESPPEELRNSVEAAAEAT